jgi:hypothetical protein
MMPNKDNEEITPTLEAMAEVIRYLVKRVEDRHPSVMGKQMDLCSICGNVSYAPGRQYGYPIQWVPCAGHDTTEGDDPANDQEYVNKEELLLLRKIAATSSDVLFALRNAEFREFHGRHKLDTEHALAVARYETWKNERSD